MTKTAAPAPAGTPEVPKAEREIVSRWKKEIALAEERELKWRKEAKEATEIYEGEKASSEEFNILYANTETIRPHLYGGSPKISVRPRYQRSQVAKVAAQVLQKALEYVVDPGNPETASFDLALRASSTSALVTDRGVVWVGYNAKFAEIGEAAEEAAEAPEPREGLEPVQPEESVETEQLRIESLAYARFICGYAATWMDVPWVARIDFMTREDLTRYFGAGKASQVKLDVCEEDDSDSESSTARPKDSKGAKLTKVYQIWDKESRQVISVATGADFLLSRVPDPLRLENFFPCPQPLRYTQQLSSMAPKPLYRFYRKQANELNAICLRITNLTRALKLRGFYDNSVQGLESLMRSPDNTLLPAENVAALQNGGIDKALWFFPIKEIVPVLQQLYLSRDSIKQTIYEIMGIADILRGGGRASESATQSNLKSQYGGFRLSDMQGSTEAFVTELLRVVAEIICELFGETTLQQITNLPLPTQEEKQLAQQQLAVAQQSGAEADPQLAQLLELPSWEEVKAFLKNDTARNFALDIESGSMAAQDTQDRMQEFSELLNGFAQFANAVGPLMEAGFLDPNAAKALFLTFIEKTNLGAEVEEAMRNAPLPPAKPAEGQPDPAAEAEAQAKAQESQMRLQATQKELELKQQMLEMKAQFEEFKMQMAQEREMRKAEQEQMRLAMARFAPAPEPQGGENAAV